MDDQISIGHLRFGEALFVANVFKVLAVLSIVGTGVAVLMVLNNPDIDSTARPEIAWAAGASGIVGSALLAFCGYVLELLVEIFEQLWHTRFGVDSSERP